MSRIARLAELESLGRPLTPEECREANAIRRYRRQLEYQRNRYRTDADFRSRQLASAQSQRRAAG